jgi:hypothetical protein
MLRTMLAADGTIEVVRGRMSEERAGQILRFLSGKAALERAEAERRLTEVVCVLLDADGEVAGVNSADPQDVSLIGGRCFWVYRSLLLSRRSRAWDEMIDAAFAALEAEFDSAVSGPIGLCLVVDRAEMERRPEAIWPDTQLMLAGYLGDGRQVRIRYFEGAAIGPGLPDSPTVPEMRATRHVLEDRYAIAPIGEASGATLDDVLAFWNREGVVSAEEAQRRIHEVHLVAMERTEGVVGVSSAYLRRNSQLRMDLFYYRLYVTAAHRMSRLGALLAARGRDLLERRFVAGEDTRAGGILYEVENEGLKRHFNKALGLPWDFTFIGENKRGDHVRVHYFRGALAPAPRTDAAG